MFKAILDQLLPAGKMTNPSKWIVFHKPIPSRILRRIYYLNATHINKKYLGYNRLNYKKYWRESKSDIKSTPG